jgi:glutamate carboxypeptidase
MKTLDGALAALRARAPEILELTRAWVEVNSFTENVAGVDRVGAMLDEAFALPGLHGERVPSTGPYGAHHVWRTAAPGAPVLLVGHHDTVFPPGHFEGWRVEGERALGPGALDMKGGLAVVRGVLAALADVGALADLPVVVVSVSDEEVSSPSSRGLLETLARGAACALVFESGRAGDAIITRRKGVGSLEARFTGKAAHAGNAHQAGVNAIWALSRFVDAAQGLTDYARGVTVNVGTVHGGTSKNTVPAEAVCALDLRYETVADAQALRARLQELAERSAASVGARVVLGGGPPRLPLERSEASAQLFAEYAACAAAAGLGHGESPLVGGGSDANTVAVLGVPAIDGLGPRGAGFHTTGEYVELASFAPKAEALLRFLWGRRAAYGL